MSAPAAPIAPAGRTGPSLGWSLIVGAAGLLIGIVAVVAIAVPLVGVFTSDVYSVPGEIHLHLHHMRYTVYQRAGERSPFGISNPDESTLRLSPNTLTVTAPDDSTVPVFYDSRSEKITRGSAEYTSQLTFDPQSSGDYVFAVHQPHPDDGHRRPFPVGHDSRRPRVVRRRRDRWRDPGRGHRHADRRRGATRPREAGGLRSRVGRRARLVRPEPAMGPAPCCSGLPARVSASSAITTRVPAAAPAAQPRASTTRAAAGRLVVSHEKR